jgi:hypothetical protein
MSTYVNGNQTELSAAGRSLLERFRSNRPSVETPDNGSSAANDSVMTPVVDLTAAEHSTEARTAPSPRAKAAIVHQRRELNNAVVELNRLLKALDITMNSCADGLRQLNIADVHGPEPVAAPVAVPDLNEIAPSRDVLPQAATALSHVGPVIAPNNEDVARPSSMAESLAIIPPAPTPRPARVPYPQPLSFDDDTIEMAICVDDAVPTQTISAVPPPPPVTRRPARPAGATDGAGPLPKLPAAPGAPETPAPKRRWRS